MIRRSPAERYIKFLVCHPDSYEVRAIDEMLRRQHLDCPGEEYINGLRDRMRVPVPFYPTNKLHGRSKRFIDRHQLLGFFHPDESAEAAHLLMRKPRAKELIETLLIIKEEPVVVAHRLKSIGIDCGPLAITRYIKFYFDLTLVDQTELRALLRMRIDHLVHKGHGVDVTSEARLQHGALKRAAYNDPRRMMVEMPIVPMAGLLNQMRMGFMPSNVEVARLAEAARGAALARVLSAELTFGPDSAGEALNHAIVAEKMSALLTELGSPDSALQKELHQLALRTQTGPVPHISELAGESVTLELSPSVDKKETENIDAG